MIRTTECFAQFFYRINPNKTIDAICGYCFTESTPTSNRDDLQTWEALHRCSHWMRQTA